MSYPITIKGKADLAAEIIEFLTGKKGPYKGHVISQKDAMDAIEESNDIDSLVANLKERFSKIKEKDLNKTLSVMGL